MNIDSMDVSYPIHNMYFIHSYVTAMLFKKYHIGSLQGFFIFSKETQQWQRWVMHEYRLDGCLLSNTQQVFYSSLCYWSALYFYKRLNFYSLFN
jgi:hypothetical protein